jgi:hypothetical protein
MEKRSTVGINLRRISRLSVAVHRAASSESQSCVSVGGPTATRLHGEMTAADGVIQTPRHPQGATYLEASRVRDRAGPQSMFLDRLQIDHDRTDILAAKSEFRHIWMARDDALAQSFLQGLYRIALGKSAKQWSLRMPALADAANGMAARAIPCEKSLAVVEGGHVRGSSSGCQQGEIDTQ